MPPIVVARMLTRRLSLTYPWPAALIGNAGMPHPAAETRQLLLNAILHMADISNPCRPWGLCKKWSDMVVEEFFLQVWVEMPPNGAVR